MTTPASPSPKPLRPPTPIAGAIVWTGFTIAHGCFMLGVPTWPLPVMLGMLVFYAIFLAIGVTMLRSARSWRHFLHEFGTPQASALPSVRPGEPVDLTLRFDRAWPSERPLAATAAWTTLDEDGDVERTFDAAPLGVSVQRLGDATLVRVTGMLPAPSAQAIAARPAAELHLHPDDQPRLGWRLRLAAAPVASGFGGFGAQAAPVLAQLPAQLPAQAPVPAPEDVAKAARMLGRMAWVMALAGVGALAWTITASAPSLYRLMLPLGLFMGAWLAWRMRGFAQAPRGPGAVGGDPRAFARQVTRAISIFGILAFLAFAADAFLPSLGAQAPAVLAKAAGNPLRPDHAIRFALPARMFNGHNTALDVTVKGSGELDGDRLALAIDELRLGELLTRPDTERLHAAKLVIAPIDDGGEYVVAAGTTYPIALGAPGPDRAYVLRDIRAELTLDANARLDRIWLRLELHHGDGYTPIDATPGHLGKLVAADDAAFDACRGASPWTTSPRTAIERQCNALLPEILANPLWRQVERYNQWQDKDNLMMAAFQSNNAQAIRILREAGVPVDQTDARGRTALMLAAWNNRRDLVEALLAAGADPTFQPRPRSHSALSGAIGDGYTDIVQLLLKDLAVLDRQAPGFGFHPAHLAVGHGRLDTVRLLLDRGLPVDSVNTGMDARGETLLMEAARSPANSIPIAQMLLDRGARLDAKDRLGKNATDWAEFFGNRELSDLLCARGLEPTPKDASETRKRASCAEPSQANGFNPDKDYR